MAERDGVHGRLDVAGCLATRDAMVLRACSYPRKPAPPLKARVRGTADPARRTALWHATACHPIGPAANRSNEPWTPARGHN